MRSQTLMASAKADDTAFKIRRNLNAATLKAVVMKHANSVRK